MYFSDVSFVTCILKLSNLCRMKYHLAEWEGHTGQFHPLLRDVVSSVV